MHSHVTGITRVRYHRLSMHTGIVGWYVHGRTVAVRQGDRCILFPELDDTDYSAWHERPEEDWSKS